MKVLITTDLYTTNTNGVLVEGKNGYEYEAEQEFCELLDTILSNPEWCHTARVQSKEIADTFDKSSFAEKIENIYESVTL